MYKVLTGAQMYSVRTLTQTQEGLDATLKALKEMGYTSVQLSGQNPALDPSAVRDALDKYGLICPATHTSFTEYEENLDALIARHQKWGCAHPGVGAMPFHFAESEAGYREFARRANAVGKKLKDAGMNLIYHNHAFEFTRFGSTTGIEILMNEFTDVQMELDVYWVQSGGGDPIEWIHKVAGRMDVVHFKEMVGRLPNEKNRSMTEMAPVGEGNFDWKKIMQACDDTGVQYAFIEQDNAVETDPLLCMRKSIDNLTALGGRFR